MMGNHEIGIKNNIKQLSESFPTPVLDNEITGEMLLRQNVLEIPSLLDPLFPKVGLACLAGSSDTGKSAFLRQLSMAVSAGVPAFLGMKLNSTHRSSIYVSTEDDETANAYLLARQNRSFGFQSSSLRGLRFIFDSNNVVEELDRRLTTRPADLVIVDCFSDLYSGSMNESNQVRLFLNQYSQLANRHQCLVIFLHHCGKRTENFLPSKHNLLGSQAFEAKMRLVLELRNDPSDITAKHICCVKGNYLSTEYKTESIKLHFSENLTFKETGEHVPFEELVPVDSSTEAKYQLAIQLKNEGLTYEQIAQKLGYKDKSSVTKLIQSYERKRKNG